MTLSRRSTPARRGARLLLALLWPVGLFLAAQRMAVPWAHLARGQVTVGSALRLAVLLTLLAAGWFGLFVPLARWWPRWTRVRARLGRARWAVAGLSLAGFAYIVLWAPLEQWLVGPAWPRDPWLLLPLLIPALAVWLGLWAWPAATPPTGGHLLAAVLAVVFTLAWLDPYTEVRAHPFSLSWSEGNRLWDYSVLFGRARYVYPADRPIPVLGDWGRIVLWGLPYLWPRADIVTVRLWRALVFTVPYLALAACAFRRGRLPWRRWVWVPLWGYVFLAQGPIYTPLILSALLVVSGVQARGRVGAALAVFGAAWYAQETRYTWMFAPAMWAGLLAVALRPDKAGLRRAGWLSAAGLLGGVLLPLALGRPQASTLLPTRAQEALGHHPLLWERLWPNPTFPPGLLLGIALAAGPALAFWAVTARRRQWTTAAWARGLWAAGLLAFFGVGTLVSVKIGGGDNLHNYDMLLIATLLALAVAWARGLRAAYMRWDGRGAWTRWGWALLLGPAYFAVTTLSPWRVYPADTAQILAEVRATVRQAAAQGEVLFMDQRQLLTFGLVDPVPLVPEYEKKRLMNEALGGNAAYFARYYHDLATQRFSLIVTEPLKTFAHAEDQHLFAAEHNAWTRWVATPTLCFYRPLVTYPKVGVQLLVPRTDHPDCRAVLPTAPAEPVPQEEMP